MSETLRNHWIHWRANPRRADPAYVLSRTFANARALLPHRPSRRLDPPVDPAYVEVLRNSAFLQSVSQIKHLSLLDEGRLANLWNMAGVVGPGAFLEIGTFRGGTARHICNAIDFHRLNTRFFCFDPFELGGFESLSDIDRGWSANDFTGGVKCNDVRDLLSPKKYATVVQGYFPDAAKALDLGEIAYVHLDVDTFDATLKCLEYLAPRLARRSLIILDDVGHVGIFGVDRAVTEFLKSHAEFVFIPLFPCQAILLPKHLW
jgi:hypothetical protein